MPGIMRRADVLLTSGLNYPMGHADLPAKLVEYLASGRPIISCGQASEIITESAGGILIPAQNPTALAEAILQLYNQPEQRERLGQNARAYAVRTFNRDHVLAAYEQMLIRVAG
jgi:colanic acid biosynthesis glycosyl transferase WcaI